MDGRAFERLDRIVTPDAHIDYRGAGGIAGSYPEIRKWLPEALGIFPGYMHFIGNFAFDIDGDSARGRVACINPMVLPKADGSAGEGETMFFGLWYLDRYRRSEEHTSELQSLMRISYAVLCLKTTTRQPETT